MFGLFKKQPVLDDDSIDWLFEAFAWSLRNFGSDFFYHHSILVTPSNRHFPGQAESIDGMANVILDQVKTYAGVAYWPTRAMNHHEYADDSSAAPSIRHVLEHGNNQKLTLFYEPQQVGNPEAMIANYAHSLAHHLGYLAQHPPPCDEDQWLHMMEAVAVYMGFGVILANTAHPYRGGGCGRCRSPSMDRSGYLAETEVTYALAIFCVLKEIPTTEVLACLKSSLKSFFKKAVKDVTERKEALAKLRAIQNTTQVRAKLT